MPSAFNGALVCATLLPGSKTMSKINVRLSEDLKRRVANAAEKCGTTARAFILEAIADKTEQVEHQSAFHAVADQRMANLQASGKSVAWSDVRQYLLALSANNTVVARPKSHKL